MSISTEYKLFRLINGEETTEFTNGEEFKEEVADIVLSNSRIEFHVREADGDTLVVEVL